MTTQQNRSHKWEVMHKLEHNVKSKKTLTTNPRRSNIQFHNCMSPLLNCEMK